MHMLHSTTAREAEMQNLIEGLEETNFEVAEECNEAIAQKISAEKKCMEAQNLAEIRLKKWHDERIERREAQDKLVDQQKIIEESTRIMKKYKDIALSDIRQHRQMQKEWENDEARHRRGGRQRWPLWVVQLICELLVNGTCPSAIPANIRSMYKTIFRTPPKHDISVNFVCECRAVVQVIGETVCAIKLGAAKDWGQLWTDATTRRQVPFTALIIGLLGDGIDDAIDPVVVSSCIFMEDESAETQADGILDKVRYCLQLVVI